MFGKTIDQLFFAAVIVAGGLWFTWSLLGSGQAGAQEESVVRSRAEVDSEFDKLHINSRAIELTSAPRQQSTCR